ncbi:Oidioi.mRNA.OKI2018_I69.chr2.g4014.t1.cds [Oikopleura dioica]|uniref:Oidioi.mRNA.OKI2018_I69.chr2.g4014.t1.cds n=1 Tax=Oikopleura dioica TaxID=34765 RepID=A0ABN7SVZ8_OIKDI|nr:Oidioi.mRNA.OKI2018_I69.chr2.g4014.t1.cds [Oikopleura dioica]
MIREPSEISSIDTYTEVKDSKCRRALKIGLITFLVLGILAAIIVPCVLYLPTRGKPSTTTEFPNNPEFNYSRCFEEKLNENYHCLASCPHEKYCYERCYDYFYEGATVCSAMTGTSTVTSTTTSTTTTKWTSIPVPTPPGSNNWENTHILGFYDRNHMFQYATVIAGDGSSSTRAKISYGDEDYFYSWGKGAMVKGQFYFFQEGSILRLDGCDVSKTSSNLLNYFDSYDGDALTIHDGSDGHQIETFSIIDGWIQLPEHPWYIFDNSLVGLDSGAIITIGGSYYTGPPDWTISLMDDIWMLQDGDWSKIGQLAIRRSSIISIGESIYIYADDYYYNENNYGSVIRLDMDGDEILNSTTIAGYPGGQAILTRATPKYCHDIDYYNYY